MVEPRRNGMQIEFGKKTLGALGFLIGYGMIQAVFYYAWKIGGFDPAYTLGAGAPTIVAGLGVCVTSVMALHPSWFE